MGISNTSKPFLFYQLHIKMQLWLMAESHHRWLWNQLLFLVLFKTPISPAEARAEIFKKTRNESAEKRNCFCYPKVKSLNEHWGWETVYVLHVLSSSLWIQGEHHLVATDFPQTCYSPKTMKSRAEVPQCLTDAPRPQQPIFHQSYRLIQKLCFFFEKSSHHLPRY